MMLLTSCPNIYSSHAIRCAIHCFFDRVHHYRCDEKLLSVSEGENKIQKRNKTLKYYVFVLDVRNSLSSTPHSMWERKCHTITISIVYKMQTAGREWKTIKPNLKTFFSSKPYRTFYNWVKSFRFQRSSINKPSKRFLSYSHKSPFRMILI